MREIKFRGKRLDNGKMVIGNLISFNDGLPVIIPPESKFATIQILREVDPNTVGQYTGFKDINGVEIYEGDILRAWDYPKDTLTFKVAWNEEHASFNVMGINTGAFEVIGNVFDMEDWRQESGKNLSTQKE